jgi:hypothetical protein
MREQNEAVVRRLVDEVMKAPATGRRFERVAEMHFFELRG